MPTKQEVALEMLALAAQGDLATDLVKVKKNLQFENDLYLGQVGQYEVWLNTFGIAVWVGETDPRGSFSTVREALAHARELNAIDQAENERYLSRLRMPAQ